MKCRHFELAGTSKNLEHVSKFFQFEFKMSHIFKLSDDVAPSLREVFVKRGWIEWDDKVHDENEWNILWTTKRHFTASSSFSLSTFQKINHFRRTSQITKKDNLTRNIRRMRANFGKIYNFYPISYQFPLQYSEFVAKTQAPSSVDSRSIASRLRDKRRFLNDSTGKLTVSASSKSIKSAKSSDRKSAPTSQSDSVWIAKPASGRRGENISLFRDVSTFHYSQPMIVQKYISNPLLVGGYKFDLRIYVLITSFRPLVVYCYDSGLCRFSTQQYDLGDLDNVYSHLTNSSINKSSTNFKTDKLVIGAGCKWTTDRLFQHLQSEQDHQQNLRQMDAHNLLNVASSLNSTTKSRTETVGSGNVSAVKRVDVRRRIWRQIHDIALLTMIPIIMDAEQSAHCFELFGFDILIDEQLKCWLLEVNGSPAIAVGSEVDEIVKYPMLNDLIDCIQHQFGFIIPNNKYSKLQTTLSPESDEVKGDDALSMDSSGIESASHSFGESLCCVEEQEDKNNVFQQNVGGFRQIFPFNATTFEANRLLTDFGKCMISNGQKWKTTVVKEIKRRRYKPKKKKTGK